MKVEATVIIQEIDGQPTGPLERPEIKVESHRIYNGFSGLVVLSVGGKEYAVATKDLEAAIKACVGLP